jgi:hypothetical protein
LVNLMTFTLSHCTQSEIENLKIFLQPNNKYVAGVQTIPSLPPWEFNFPRGEYGGS